MAKNKTKYIFVTGGVLSGVGKGITAASLGSALKARGFLVSIQKCDQYLNVDAGTLNPAEHGEVFVTDDGAETDLDLGHYERFLDQNLTQASSLMTGRVFKKVIDGERAGKYLGKTVQVVPHVTGLIQEEIMACAAGSDIHIVEIGGTVGDIEGLHFIEAIRELGLRVGRENCLYAHVVYVPYLGASSEFKTKPAQHAVLELRSLGIVPELLFARSEKQPPQRIIEKLSLFGGVAPDGVALLPNSPTVFEVPLKLEREGIVDFVVERLKLKGGEADLTQWRWVARRAVASFSKTVTVGVVAKYLDNDDTYMSVVEALKSACWKHGVNLSIKWVNAEEIIDQKSAKKELSGCDGIVVPGGFGPRGIEGKITAATYSITKGLPYLGLCLGLQVAVIAQARLAGLQGAHSTEFDKKSPYPVIATMDGQADKLETGGTMRLGSYPCVLEKGSLAAKLYGTQRIDERHRHRYEVNNEYRDIVNRAGLKIVGTSPDTSLVEVVEHINHPYFIASQFHPEFKSRPNKPHPLFDGFINTLKKRAK